MSITPVKLAELEALESTATPGEWNAEVRYNNDFGWAAACGAGISHAAANADAAFTAALRNNARDLFAALREAWAALEQVNTDDRHSEAQFLAVTKERDEARMLVQVLDQQVQGNGIGLMNIGMIVGCDGPGLIEKVAALKEERDEFKAKLDAELPAAWREDIDSLNHLLESSARDVLAIAKERDEALAGQNAIYGCISVMARYLGIDATELICNPSRVLERETGRDEARGAEIRERWEPSPPGTPEWDAQRRFDIARAHAPYDVRFLLGETTRLQTVITLYREALEHIQATPCYTGRPLGCEGYPACPSCTASAALVNLA